jgi:DNA-binding CsgD family transcriptional regulator
MRDPSPFKASEIRRDPEFAGLDWESLQSETVRNGEGLIVPVYQGTEFRGGLSLGGAEADVSPLARSMMQVVAHISLEKYFQLRDRKGQQVFPLLSVRETQCLRYVAIGHEDAEISRILGISARTVRFHVDSAKAKLGVGSRVQAVTKAMRERIIAV